MGINPLDPGSTAGKPDRDLHRGHGTRALGPSDSSDSGSDLSGTSAGRDVGDADLDSDSDRQGTGERAAAGREPASQDGADIDVDHVEEIAEDLDEDEDKDDEG
jgi:hypothetical protein